MHKNEFLGKSVGMAFLRKLMTNVTLLCPSYFYVYKVEKLSFSDILALCFNFVFAKCQAKFDIPVIKF